MVKSMSSLPCLICGGLVEVTRPHFRIRRVEPGRLKRRHRDFALRPSHWACYEPLPERPWIAEEVIRNFTDGFECTETRILWSNKQVALVVSAEGPDPDNAILAFSETGTILEAPFPEWRPDLFMEDLGPSDRGNLSEVVEELRLHFPTGESLIKDLPWKEMKDKAEEIRRSVEHDIAIYRGQWPEVRPGIAVGIS